LISFLIWEDIISWRGWVGLWSEDMWLERMCSNVLNISPWFGPKTCRTVCYIVCYLFEPITCHSWLVIPYATSWFGPKTCRTVLYLIFGPRTCRGWSFLILSLDWVQGLVPQLVISYPISWLGPMTCPTACYILCYLLIVTNDLSHSLLYLMLPLDCHQGLVPQLVISYAISYLNKNLSDSWLFFMLPLLLWTKDLSDSLLYLTLPLDWNQRLVGQLAMLMPPLNFGPMICRAVCYSSIMCYLLILA
jgi:hypothetical protein